MRGKTVAILASGPSLTAEDIEAVRHLPTIAVNSTFMVAPFCSVLFAGDPVWWEAHHKEAVGGKKYTTDKDTAKKYGIEYFGHDHRQGYNSGMLAIEFAIKRGAAKIILLGFDCSLKNGRHHHGDHTKTQNPDSDRVGKWHKQFQRLREANQRASVVNCSRYTELTSFPCLGLEAALIGGHNGWR